MTKTINSISYLMTIYSISWGPGVEVFRPLNVYAVLSSAYIDY